MAGAIASRMMRGLRMIDERLDSFLMVHYAQKDEIYYLCDSGSRLCSKQVRILTDTERSSICTVDTITAPIVREVTFVSLLETDYTPTPTLQKENKVVVRDDESKFFSRQGTIVDDVKIGKIFRVQLDIGEEVWMFSKEVKKV